MIRLRRALSNRQQFDSLYPQGPGQHDQLDDVDPALPALDPRDEGLMTFEPPGEFVLRQRSTLSRRDQCIAQRLMSRTPDRLSHASQTSCERANPVCRLSKKWIL